MSREDLRKVVSSSLLALTLAVASLGFAGCGDSPTEPDAAYAVVVGGGLVNLAGGMTIQQFQALIDAKNVQTTDYSPPKNIGSLDVRTTLSTRGSHTLTLRVPKQTVASATYTSYSVVIVVTDMRGNIVYQGTPPDRSMTMNTTSDMNISFGPW